MSFSHANINNSKGTKQNRIDLTSCYAIILHLDRAEHRKKNVRTLQQMFPHHKIWNAIDMNKMTDSQKQKSLDLSFFHRIPNNKMNPKHIIGWCLNAVQHLEILNWIVRNKIDNVIVFEDDAALIDQNSSLVIDCSNKDYVHLGGWFYKPGKLCKQHAMFYPSHKVVEAMLEYLNDPKKLRTIDYMFSNYIQPNFKWGYENLFYQEGESMTTPGVKAIK
jgi:hypothetical protein